MDVVRITELQPKTYVEQGDYIAIDNQSDGTKKVQFTNLLDDTLSQENKIAPANIVGNEITTVKDEMEGEIATIRAAVGSPLKASTVAQMTDKNKIYVYVGSESGYTNGNWYYWNGSAWTSGGVYNSVAVVTDPTLTLSGVPADAKATGDEIGDLKSDLGTNVSLTDGYLNSDGSIATASTNAEKTTSFIPVYAGQTITINLKLSTTVPTWGVFGVYDDDKTWIERTSDSPVATNDRTWTYTVPTGVRFVRFSFRSFDLMRGFSLLFSPNIMEQLSELNSIDFDDISAIKTSLIDGAELDVDAKWEQGNINASTGADSSATNACRTQGFIVGAGTYVIDPNGQKTYINVYDLNGVRTAGANWGVTETNIFTLDDTHKFRVVVMNIDSSDLNPSNVTASVKIKTVLNDCPKTKNENCIFICHQGYPYDGRATNNSRLEGYRECAERGFDWGETDCKLTLDNQLVGCHDSSFVDATSGETIVIAEHTLAELKTYNYYGSTIATIEEIMIECKKYGLGLALDQLDLSYIDALYASAKKTGMLDNIAWLVGIGSVSLVNAILEKDNKATIMVLSSTASISEHIVFANSCCNGNNKVYAYPPFTAGSASDFATASVSLHRDAEFAIWIVDNLATIKNYLPYVSGICSNLYCYKDVLPVLY